MIPLTEWFLSSSVLILVILLLRAVLGQRLSLRIRYALWAVVLVRLLIPFSPITSGLTLSAISAPIQERAESQMLYAIPTRTYENQYEYDTPHYSRTEHSQQINIGGTSYEFANYLSGGSISYQGQRTDYFFLMPADEMIALIWKGGMFVCTIWIIRRNLTFSRSLKKTRILYPDVDSPIPVYLVSEGLPTPCLFGLFAPAVYLTPEAAADEGTLRHVLAHELTHYAHKDHIWSFLRCVCLVLHWYNPLVWLACTLSKRDGELACDEGAVKRLGEEERIHYGRTLLCMVARRSQRPGDLLTCSTAMAEGKKPIQQRIQLLVKRPKTTVGALFLAICITTLSLPLVFSSQNNPRQMEFTTYEHFLREFDMTRYWILGGNSRNAWVATTADLSESTRSELMQLLSTGTPEHRWVNRTDYNHNNDRVSFSNFPTQLYLYETENGCHLVEGISFEDDILDSFIHYRQIKYQYCHLATFPSGTVQAIWNLLDTTTLTPLTQEELNFFNTGDFFDHGDRTDGDGRMNIRNQLLSSFYVDPRDINLYELFYCGSGQSLPDTAQRREIYNAILNSTHSPDTACTIVTRAEMDAVLTEHMGITLEETNKVGLEYMDYLPEYDAYYNFHGDTNYGLMVHFTSGLRSGNTIWLYYQDTFGLLGGGPCVLTLYQEGEQYYFRANQPATATDTGAPAAPSDDISDLIRSAASFHFTQGPLSSYIGPTVTDPVLVDRAIQLLLSGDPYSGTVQNSTPEDGATLTLYGNFGNAGNELSLPISNQTMCRELLSLTRIQDQRIQEAQALSSNTYHQAILLLSEKILAHPQWPKMLTQFWNYDRDEWNLWLEEQLGQLGFDPYFNQTENLWFLGERNTPERICLSGAHLSYEVILNDTASPVGLSVPPAASADKTVTDFGDSLAHHYLTLDPRHPKAVTSARLIGAEIFDQSETQLCARISLAVQPIEPDTVFWMSGSGIDLFKDGPYAGEWEFTLDYLLELQPDGNWLCTKAVTGGLSAS